MQIAFVAIIGGMIIYGKRKYILEELNAYLEGRFVGPVCRRIYGTRRKIKRT